jgi:hypothetical protein
VNGMGRLQGSHWKSEGNGGMTHEMMLTGFINVFPPTTVRFFCCKLNATWLDPCALWCTRRGAPPRPGVPREIVLRGPKIGTDT